MLRCRRFPLFFGSGNAFSEIFEFSSTPFKHIFALLGRVLQSLYLQFRAQQAKGICLRQIQFNGGRGGDSLAQFILGSKKGLNLHTHF